MSDEFPLTIQKFGKDGWVLRDHEGGDLMISNLQGSEGHGCISPRKADAIAEAKNRIERDGYTSWRIGPPTSSYEYGGGE